MRKLLILTSGLLFAGAMFSTTATAEIQIGVAGPMTGQYAAFGRQMRRGVDMAIKEINGAGGINGEKLALAIGDDRCDNARAVKVADEFVAKKVSLVVGHFCSGTSIEASQVYAQAEIVQISPASSNPAFTDDRPGPGVFRIAPSDRRQGMFAGAYIGKRFAGERVALLNDKTRFGTYLTEAARDALFAATQPPVLYESYVSGEKNYSALVAKMRTAGIAVVYIGGYHDDIGRIAREMRKQGMTAQLIASDALATLEFWKIAGRAGEGTLMSFITDPRENAGATGIVKKFRARKIEPDGYTLASYTSVKLWADAAKSAGRVDFHKVVEGLMKVDMDTPIGRVRFDDHGNIEEPRLTWYVWHKGNYAPLKGAP